MHGKEEKVVSGMSCYANANDYTSVRPGIVAVLSFIEYRTVLSDESFPSEMANRLAFLMSQITPER